MSTQTVSPASRGRDFVPAHPAFTSASGVPSRGSVPSGVIPTDRHVTAEIAFAGHGADNETVTFTVWLVRRVDDQYELYSLGGGTATLGAVQADADSIYEGARLADEISFTPSPYLTYLEGLTGHSHEVYPDGAGDGTLAVIGFPDIGGQVEGLVVEITGGTGTDGNAYAAAWT